MTTDDLCALLARCVPAIVLANELAAGAGIDTTPGERLLAEVLAAVAWREMGGQ
jgi:hypothetical protein